MRAEDLLIVPLAIQCIYQWNRVTDRVEDQINCPDDLAAAISGENNIKIVCLIDLSMILTLTAVHFDHRSLLLLVLALLLGFFYSTPISARWPRARFKNLFVIKNVSSAVIWTVLTVLYPTVHAGQQVSARACVAAMYMFSAVCMVEVIWDVRDVLGDLKAGVRTIPSVLGLSRCRRYLTVANILSGAFIAGAFVLGVLPAPWLPVLFNTGLMFFWNLLLFYELESTRLWADLLVLLQTLLLICLAVISG